MLPMSDANFSTLTRKTGGGVAFPLIVLLFLVAATRLAWLWLAPRAASLDLKAWGILASEMTKGTNPYDVYGMLNWPPFWMEAIYVLTKLALHFHVNFIL